MKMLFGMIMVVSALVVASALADAPRVQVNRKIAEAGVASKHLVVCESASGSIQNAVAMLNAYLNSGDGVIGQSADSKRGSLVVSYPFKVSAPTVIAQDSNYTVCVTIYK